MMTEEWPNADDALMLIWRDAIETRGSWADFDGRALLDFVEHVIRYAHGDRPRPYEEYWGTDFHSKDERREHDERLKALTWDDFPRRGGPKLGEQEG